MNALSMADLAALHGFGQVIPVLGVPEPGWLRDWVNHHFTTDALLQAGDINYYASQMVTQHKYPFPNIDSRVTDAVVMHVETLLTQQMDHDEVDPELAMVLVEHAELDSDFAERKADLLERCKEHCSPRLQA